MCVRGEGGRGGGSDFAVAGSSRRGKAIVTAHLEHCEELLLGDFEAVVVSGVHHENQRVRVGVVASPVGANARLAAQVPDLELDVFVLQGLHVEPDGRDRLLNLACLQPVCAGRRYGNGR